MPADRSLGFTYRIEPGQESRTLLLLHGTGADENDLIPLGRALDGDATLLSPRGRVNENGALRYFRRHAEGRLDIEDMKERTHELAAFVEAARDERLPSGTSIVAVGFSNGANIAAATLLLHPGLLAAAVLLRPMFAFAPDPLPDLSGTPILISSGRGDPLIAPEQAERLAALLREAGADVTHGWVPGGHGLDMTEVETAAAWLRGLDRP